MIEWFVDNFPPLNLFNYPNFMISEIDIKDYKDMNYKQPYGLKEATEELKIRNTTAQKGIKYDSDKPRMDLLDPFALEGLAKVLTFGANKYAANNWRNGIAYSRIISSLLRHLSAIQRGEITDPESGLPHIDHIGCNWMFLSSFMKTQPHLNDLWWSSMDQTAGHDS